MDVHFKEHFVFPSGSRCSALKPEALIPLKAAAWLDLTRRKTAGEIVDSKDIQKHRRDVFRLFAVLSQRHAGNDVVDVRMVAERLPIAFPRFMTVLSIIAISWFFIYRQKIIISRSV
jgi:hypothetical protein